MSSRRDRSREYNRRRSRSRDEHRPRRRESPEPSYRRGDSRRRDESNRRERRDDRHRERRGDNDQRRHRSRETDSKNTDRRRDEESSSDQKDWKDWYKDASGEWKKKDDKSSRSKPEKEIGYSSHPGSSTIWLGSLPDSATDDEVLEALRMVSGTDESAGLKLVAQRGFGYVRLVDEESAKRVLEYAIKNPLQVGGKRIRVDACENMPHLQHPFKPNLQVRPPNCNTLFVGNLSPDTTEEELVSFFTSRVSDLTVNSVSLRKGTFKGGLTFAHVRFGSPEDALKAVEKCSGRLHGIRLRLDWAVEKAHMSAPEQLPRLHEDLRGQTTKMYIGGLNDSIEEGDVIEVMKKFGPIINMKLHRDKNGVRSFGYIGYTTVEAATAAVDNINSVTIKGLRLRADFAKVDHQRSGPEGIPISLDQVVPPRMRSLSPEYPRSTPVSYQIPTGYGPMRSWQECYDKNRQLVNGAV